MITYKDAGVDISAGDETVERIKPLVRKTFTPGVLTDIGAFGGFFQLDKDAYEQPVLVSSVDGVGTKLKVAFMAGKHDTVGQDLVNHCVNDIAVCGAVPLFFLDYFATGKLNPVVAEQIISGFAVACSENGCALIGGETAEMPGLYQGEEYDLAGTVVGIVEKKRLLDGSRVKKGDVLIGLPSTGLHTNGYSLARKVLFGQYGIDDAPPELGGNRIGEVLLRVHRSYLKPIQALMARDLANGFAHITGGGLEGNTRRIVRSPNELLIDWNSWDIPVIFRLIQRAGNVPVSDMRRTFNLGVGLVVVVSERAVDEAIEVLDGLGEISFKIGLVG